MNAGPKSVPTSLREAAESLVGRAPLARKASMILRRRHSLAEIILFLSLPLIFLFLALSRPPISFYALPLAPIALAAVLYETVGGTLAALATMVVVVLLLALDPDAVRRGTTLQQVWPILITYLAAGPLVGWLTTRERESERQLVAAARHLRVIQDIVQAINTSLDLDETLRTIFAETHRLFPFEQAAVMLSRGKSLEVVAVSQQAEEAAGLVGQVFPEEGTASGWVVQHRRPWAGSRNQVDQYTDLRAICPPDVSLLLVPLQFQNAVIGVFALAGYGLELLDTIEMENLTQIAGQVSMAIEHARLFESQRERSRALAAISDAGRQIAASLNLDRTLRLVMSKAAETLPMDAGALFRFDAESQLYRVAVSHNLSQEHVDQITFAFDEGVPGWTVRHRQAIIIPEAAVDDRVHHYVVEDGVKSVLAVPLEARDQAVGVLTLYGKTETHAFDDEALRLAQVYADQAAVFIENARLVDELREAAAELEARVERRTEQLRQSQAQAIRAEKLAVVGRLAGSVAHEVNNPLQAITLNLQLIAEKGLNESAQDHLAIVQQELARIAGIVRNLLDFARPKPGLRAPQDLGVILDDVLTLVGKQLQQSAVAVECAGFIDLAPVLAVGDQLKQVILNLVLNAIEAMPDGGTLRINARQSDDQVTVSVADTGIGMTLDALERLFEPFFSTKRKGSGLGLAISHEIISQHGGTLEASSLAGQGSTFTIALPINALLDIPSP
jgi:signal transduction histidine kinase